MELDQVQGLDAQVAPGAVGPGAEFLCGGVFQAGGGGAADHLGGDEAVPLRVLRPPSSDDLFAAPIPVDVRRVEEGDSGLCGGVEDGEGISLRDLAPVRAELPGAQPDLGDAASGAAEGAVVHGLSSRRKGRSLSMISRSMVGQPEVSGVQAE